MADDTNNQDQMADEWAAMAEGDAGAGDADALAEEWAAMAEGDEGGIDDGGDPSNTKANRILNQEEIDNLLGFADADDDGKEGIEALINSGLVSYERLPMLEVVYDRLVRLMSTSLRNFTSDNVEVSIDDMTAIRFGDYLNSIPLPAMLAVFKAVEWDNYALMVVDSSLIYSIVDVLLGGRRGTAAMAIEGRPYTTIERTLVERMISIILNDLNIAFEPLSKVTFKFERLETNPRFATISRPANAAILTRLRIDMEDRGGNCEFLLPYGTLEPIRKILLQMFLGEKFGRDSIWETHLATEIWSTNVNLDAVLVKQEFSLNDIMSWEVGTQIFFDKTPKSLISLRCGDIDLFHGEMGRKDKNIAIKITENLNKKGLGK